MSFNKEDLQKLVFSQVARVSRRQFDINPGEFTALVSNNMREALAHHIQNAKVEKRFGDEVVEARLELYVASPDEFWAVVNHQAERIANRYGRTVISTVPEYDNAIAHASVDKLLRENSKLTHAVSLLIEGCRHSPEGSRALSKWDAIRGK